MDDALRSIENDIRKAQFEQPEAERYMSRRERRKMAEALRIDVLRSEMRRAYRAGYRNGNEQGSKYSLALFMGALVIILIMEALL